MVARTSWIFGDHCTGVELHGRYIRPMGGIVSQSTICAIHVNLILCASGIQTGCGVVIDGDRCKIGRKVAVSTNRTGESDSRAVDIEASIRSRDR